MESDFTTNNSTLRNFLSRYVEDINYAYWIYMTVYYPLILTFLLPSVFVILIYFSSITLHIFKFHRWIFLNEIRSEDTNFWKVAIKFIAAVWDAHSTLYHGYEIRGMDHLPKNGPALLIYYHGAIPIDMYYFVARIYLKLDRLIYTVGDRFLSKLPGWKIISTALKVSPGTVSSCVETLKRGNLLAISPGGVYEAQFGNHYYELLWQKRMGFAKVAIEAKVPIIPMFTENLREGFRNVGIFDGFFAKLYAWTRIPLRPIYGGFPVKFVTHLGPPIYPEEGMSPKELQEKTAAAIEKLIVEKQRIPGSIVGGLLDRFFEKTKIDVIVNKTRQRRFVSLGSRES